MTQESESLFPFVVIRPDAGPFMFNEQGERPIAEADQMARELNEVVYKYLPWNQAAMGPFAWVEMREDPDGT